jgi:hypothetical protein
VPGLATIHLGSGRAAVAVVKSLMKPGEVIEIRTPNSVTAIRGTVVIAEVSPAPDGYRSTITILKGLVDVTKLDQTGALSGPAVKVGALERVTVIGGRPVPAPEKITQEAASALASDFSAVPRTAPAASTEALSAEAKRISLREAIQLTGGATQTASPTASVDATTAGAGQTVTTVVGGVANTANGTVNAVGNAVTSLTGGAANTLNGVTGGVSNTLGAVTGGATGALSGVTGGATGALTGVTGAATGALTGVTGGATGALTGLTSTVTQTVAPPVTSPVTNLVTTVTNPVNTVLSPVTNTILPNLLHK